MRASTALSLSIYMKRHSLAFLVIGSALALTACNQSSSPKPGDPPFTEAQETRLRQIIKEEFANAQLPEGGLADSKKLREEIDKMVLAKVEEEIANGALKDQLNGERVIKILQRAQKRSGGGSDYELEAVDLSQYPTVDGKIKRIIQEFEGVRSYSGNNPLVKQLAELGEQAKPQLFKALQEIGAGGQNNWAGRMALAEALKPMLTIDDKDMLLEDLKSKDPQLGEVVRRLHVEEAGDYALQRIRELASSPNEYIHHELINIAVDMHEEEALPLLLDRLGAPDANSASWLATTIDQNYPDVDMTAQLRAAAQRVTSNNPYEGSSLSQLMLKRGMPEGLGLAADALLADTSQMGGGSDYYREQVRSTLRRYVNVTGSDEEVAKWIMENRGKLKWNPQLQMFE